MGFEVELEFRFQNRRFTDAAKGLEAVAKQFDRNVNLIPRELKKALKEYLDQVRKGLIKVHSKPFSNPANVPATGERNLLRRRGGIEGIKTFVTGGKDVNKVAGGLIIPFPISVHEKGATIRAKRAQYLTIPLPAALDSRGVPLRASAREWDNTFVQRSKRGNLLIFQKRGASLVPLFLLKREVTLPPRLKAEQALEAGSDFFVDEAIERIFKKLQAGF
jgi:hypothetical protein